MKQRFGGTGGAPVRGGTLVCDDRFQQKCRHELFDVRRDRAMILVSHEPSYIRQYCHRAAVLERGRLTEYSNIDDAYNAYLAALATS